MKVIFTKHAKYMLFLRGIEDRLAVVCAKNPDRILPAKFGKKTYLKDFGKKYLKMIVFEEAQSITVITLFWLEKIRYILDIK